MSDAGRPTTPRTPLNLWRELEAVSEHWFPRVVARVNDHYLKVARVRGELVWHAHDGQDELFLVLKGRLRIRLEAPGAGTEAEPGPAEVVLEEGDVWVVPAGTRHNPVADQECWIALVEPVDTEHTGDERSPLERSIEEQLGR